MSKFFKKKPLSAMIAKQLTGAILTVLCVQNAMAEEQAPEADKKIETIVVTAQYRSESIQEVPIAISAFGQDFIEDNRMNDVKDVLDFTPGFAGKSKDSFIDTVSIRGISSNDFGVGGDPSVGIFKDGVYQGRNGSAVTSFFDMERVEALRGPQGFLYGRNAISGTIAMTTNKPHADYLEGLISIDLGQRGLAQQRAMLNLPIDDNWSVRFAAYNGKEDGYVKNYYAEGLDDLISYDNRAFRVSLGYDSDNFDAILRVESETRDQSGSVYIANNAQGNFAWHGIDQVRGGEFELDSDLAGNDKDDGKVSGVSLSMNWNLDWATLTSITGYREHVYEYAEDYDGTPKMIGHWAQEQDGDYASQELRLVSNSDGPLTWIVGVSAYRENILAQFDNLTSEEVICNYWGGTTCENYYWGAEWTPSSNGAVVESSIVDGTNTGYGAYANVVYAFTDKLKGDFGLRYSYDNKDFAIRMPVVESLLGPWMMAGYNHPEWSQTEKDWGALTPRGTITYSVNDDWNVWASATKGYKSGGFGSSAILDPYSDDSTPQRFEPELVWSYEAGIKGGMLDNRILLDTNVFYYEYTDLQLRYWDSDITNLVVDNVGKVVGQGIEGSIKYVPTDNFDIYVGASYMDTEISNVDDEICVNCDGNRLRQQPKVVLSAVANYTYPLGNGYFFVRGSVYHQSEFFGAIGNGENSIVDGYTDVALATGYDSESGWSVTAYVDNVFDERYWDGASQGDAIYPAMKFGPSRPRTLGVNFSYYFDED